MAASSRRCRWRPANDCRRGLLRWRYDMISIAYAWCLTRSRHSLLVDTGIHADDIGAASALRDECGNAERSTAKQNICMTVSMRVRERHMMKFNAFTLFAFHSALCAALFASSLALCFFARSLLLSLECVPGRSACLLARSHVRTQSSRLSRLPAEAYSA